MKERALGLSEQSYESLVAIHYTFASSFRTRRDLVDSADSPVVDSKLAVSRPPTIRLPSLGEHSSIDSGAKSNDEALWSAV